MLSPEIKAVREGAHAFAPLLRERQSEGLPAWLADAEQSPVSEMRSFATGLRQEEAAVSAAWQYAGSNGPVEGHINRLKMLKRQRFGRVYLALRRRHFLRTPHAESAQARSLPGPVPAQREAKVA